MPGVSARGKENIRVPTCPGLWPAGRGIRMSGNLVCGKENTQHARGCGPREGEYPTCPGSWPAGSKILNMPRVLTRGKKKIGVDMPGDLTHEKERKEVTNITVKRLWEPMT